VSERRATRRYRLALPISFRRVPAFGLNEVLRGDTLNISTRGIYFTTDRHLAANEVLEFSVNFPGLAQGADVLVIGRARVLRVVQNSETTSEPVRIAVLTEEFNIVEPYTAK
jgi:hypothetical protein